MSGQRLAAYVVGGVGLFGLVYGSVEGGLALRGKSDIEAQCQGPDGTSCTHQGKAAADAAQSSALQSTVGFGLGVAGVGTAVVLLLTDPGRKRQAAARRVGVLAAGREGVILGLRGEW